jgi:hypothetical protein
MDPSCRLIAAIVTACLCLCPVTVAAQTADHRHEPAPPDKTVRAANAQSSRERPSVTAIRTSEAPRIDGVLDDAAWQSAMPVDGFVQQEPNEGQPATDRTEVRVLFDRGHLYIGVRAYASTPVTATEMRRDADRLFDEDNFQVILDTFHDSRNGYMFVTTPLGARLEQQIFDEGENVGRGGNTSNINRNWDGVWNAAARIDDQGWTAEMDIPFSTVRFVPSGNQVWGVNFQRHIRSKNEVVLWSPLPKAFALTRVSLAGELHGLSDISRGLDLRLKPFFVGGAHDVQLTRAGGATDYIHDVGLDARYGLTAGLNMDVTINTDFAQVEVDEQQVNLTRYSVFYPEKRDFFLENSNFFTMGTGGVFSTTQVQTDLFFSRRVGLSDAGTPIPIQGGVRVAGKSGRNNIGVVDIQTDDYFSKPGDNFFVGRYSRDIFKRSRVGAIFVNKDTLDGSSLYNRTMGVDANLAFSPNLQFQGFLARTDSPDKEGNDGAYFGRIAYRDPKWNLYLNYLDVQENFNAEAGFVQRTGIRTTKGHFGPTPRPTTGNVKLFEPMYVLTYTTDQSNRLIYRQHHVMLGTTLRDDTFINVFYQNTLDVLDAPFRIRPDVTIPVGTYQMHEWYFTLNSSPGRRIYERVTVSPTQFYDGSRLNLSAAAGLRATSQFSAEVQFNRNDVKMPWGDFVVNLSTLRLDYTFSPRMTIRSLSQYNTSTHEISTNVRFNFIYRPGSDIYVVYNDLSQTGLPADIFGKKDRQLVVKATYLLQR